MSFLDIDNTIFQVAGYPVSYVELAGTLFGLAAVYYATKAKLLTWLTGIINEFFFFILFFQVQLYADMFLQIFFFAVTLYGWHNWKRKNTLFNISHLSHRTIILISLTITIGTLISGYSFSNIHLYMPGYFKIPAAYPFIDSFIMVCSIMATYLLAKKKIENWHLWIIVDICCIVLYSVKGIYFLALEYLIFLCLASYGLYRWNKEMINDQSIHIR